MSHSIIIYNVGVIQKENKRIYKSRANESNLLDADDADNANPYF